MKKTGKIFSLVMALLIVVLSLSVMALAADSYTITIKGDNSTADHTYEAYQIFAGDLHDPSPAKEEAIQDKVLSNRLGQRRETRACREWQDPHRNV